MLTPRPEPRASSPEPRGFSLAELVVALAVAGVALGAFAFVVARQERAYGELTRRVRARGQLRDGLTALAADLRAVSPRAGDITPGGARDSSIEFRTTVGTAVACQTLDRALVVSLASFVTPPQPGDTAWAYMGTHSAAGWAPFAVEGVAALDAESSPGCTLPPEAGTIIGRRRPVRTRYSLTLAAGATGAPPAGTPVRVTRAVRYSLYRAPDGRWYLGRREWSAALGRFETVQPVSGPYRDYAPLSGLSGLELRYFDADHDEIPSGSASTDRIAGVTLTLRAPSPASDREVRDRRDVATITVGMRNRR